SFCRGAPRSRSFRSSMTPRSRRWRRPRCRSGSRRWAQSPSRPSAARPPIYRNSLRARSRRTPRRSGRRALRSIEAGRCDREAQRTSYRGMSLRSVASRWRLADDAIFAGFGAVSGGRKSLGGKPALEQFAHRRRSAGHALLESEIVEDGDLFRRQHDLEAFSSHSVRHRDALPNWGGFSKVSIPRRVSQCHHSIRLLCFSRSGGKMRLFGIEAHPTLKQADLRTYVCTQCDGVQTEILPPAL